MAQKSKKQTRNAPRPVAAEINVTESAPITGAGRSFSAEFNPDYSQTLKDLRRIGILAGSFFALLVALAIFMP
jgi:hypothetical protein